MNIPRLLESLYTISRKLQADAPDLEPCRQFVLMVPNTQDLQFTAKEIMHYLAKKYGMDTWTARPHCSELDSAHAIFRFPDWQITLILLNSEYHQ